MSQPWTTFKRSRASNDSLSYGAVRVLCYILVLTLLYPRTRLGLTGPILAPVYAGLPRGLPYLTEVVILLIAAVLFLGLLRREIPAVEFGLFVAVWWLITFDTIAYVRTLLLPIAAAGGAEWGQFRAVVEYIVLFFVLRNLLWKTGDIEKILNLFIAVMLFHSVLIVLGFVAPGALQIQTRTIYLGRGMIRRMTFFETSTSLSINLAMAWIVHLSYSILGGRRWIIAPWRLSNLIISVILGFAVWTTGNRSALLAMLVTTPFMIRFSPAKATSKLPVFVAAFTGIAILTVSLGTVAVMSSRVEDLIFRGDWGGSRLYLWRDALGVIARFPLGVGFNTYPNMGEIVFGRPMAGGHTQSAYLGFLVAVGIPGFVLLMAILFDAFQKMREKIRTTRDILQRDLLISMRYAIITFLIVAMFEEFWFTMHSQLAFWLLLALASSHWITKPRL